MIGTLIKWDHSRDWAVPVYEMNQMEIKSERIFLIELTDEDFSYMAGHIIDGKKQ